MLSGLWHVALYLKGGGDSCGHPFQQYAFVTEHFLIFSFLPPCNWNVFMLHPLSPRKLLSLGVVMAATLGFGRIRQIMEESCQLQ